MRLYLFIIMEEMPKRSYLGDFELMVLLAVMRLGDDAYGVPISREIEQQSGREVALATVYAALERLAEKGLVSSELGESTAQRGGRAKRYFHPTKRGLREVREARATFMNLWRGLRDLEGE
jgi:PadR family transcriptional regulator PadR